MEDFMNFDVSFIYKIWSFLKTIFWKKENIIYINSNKKMQIKDNIDEVIKTRKYKWVICESNIKLGYKFYNIHLIRMKKNLYDILRNSSDSNDLVYSGFVSPMFAVYDGYCIGDVRKITFADLDSSTSKAYKVQYEKNYLKKDLDDVINKDVINIFYECTNDIKSDIPADFKYSQKSGKKVTKQYLQDIYSFTRNTLDLCLKNNVKRINFYIAAKQPIGFIIGTAIQSYHPTIYVYEFLEGNYLMPLIIQKGKFGD